MTPSDKIAEALADDLEAKASRLSQSWVWDGYAPAMRQAAALLRRAAEEIGVLRSVLGQNKAAIDFYDKVQASSDDEKIAAGSDHWDFLLAAARQARSALADAGGER
jgi:hypothetical protein